MARGINKVLLIGNLGADPETRYMPSGGAVVNLRLATSENWLDKQSGERQERTEWHRVVLFGKLAEVAAQYLHKGAKVWIEGRLQTRKWQGQDGQDRFTTEIIVNDMQMLDSRGSSNSLDDAPSSTWRSDPRAAIPPSTPHTHPTTSSPSSESSAGPEFDLETDVPF